MSAQQKLAAIRADVTEAACRFEARWTLRALRRVDPELHRKVVLQGDLFDEAYVTGSEREVALHGAAMVRGWEVAIRALETAKEPDDAYLEGFDAATGRRVAIGFQKAVAGRLSPGTVFITPDDVAALLGGRERLLGDVLAQFPGATIVQASDEAA